MTFRDLLTLPTWVYVMEDAATDVLYVGITCGLRGRLRQHRYEKPWWPEVALIQAELYPDRTAALAVESQSIRGREAPRYNREIPRAMTLPACDHFSDLWLECAQLYPEEV